jgi:hypothetical protein
MKQCSCVYVPSLCLILIFVESPSKKLVYLTPPERASRTQVNHWPNG